MHPIIFTLGPFTIYSYGAMVAAGFGIATFLIYRRAPKFGIDPDKMIDITIAMILSGVIGARLLYVLINFNYYFLNPVEIFKLSKGGLIWYGGFSCAVFTLAIYIKRKGLDIWKTADLIAPYIALAQSFGRIGCFLNGCCYGPKAGGPSIFGITFPGELQARFPTQILSAIALFIIYLILRRWQDKKHFTGAIFIGYCVLYPLKRFFIEFLRADNRGIFFGLTMSQIISVVVFFAALSLFTYKALQWKKGGSDLR